MFTLYAFIPPRDPNSIKRQGEGSNKNKDKLHSEIRIFDPVFCFLFHLKAKEKCCESIPVTTHNPSGYYY